MNTLNERSEIKEVYELGERPLLGAIPEKNIII